VKEAADGRRGGGILERNWVERIGHRERLHPKSRISAIGANPAWEGLATRAGVPCGRRCMLKR
jgi:hypothetical protein